MPSGTSGRLHRGRRRLLGRRLLGGEPAKTAQAIEARHAEARDDV
ncbi:hypothetical protein [Amycolatopsis sp. cmx-4-61]